jgi:hypothetical protein
VLVARLICVPRDDGAKTMYAIVVECRGADEKETEGVADKIASGFNLLEPEKPAPSPGK